MKFSKKFIRANNKKCSFEELIPAPYFRKNFDLTSKPEKAEITICGLGFYELYINGKNITKGPLAPYISNPDDVCYYDNYDITDLLNLGKNTIGVLLGNGFRNCYGGFIWDFQKGTGQGPVTFALCLEVNSAEGNWELEADETFKTHPSPIRYDDLRLGYCYDANFEVPDWNMPDFDDSQWTSAELGEIPAGVARLSPVEPIVVTKELRATEIKHYDTLAFAHDKTSDELPPFADTIRDNVYVYDFGVNTAGVTRLKIHGKPGQKITIRHGEHTVRGDFSINTVVFQRNSSLEEDLRYREYGQTDVFICKGGEETFIPRFKYDGFRYAYIEGLEENQATQDAVVCLVMNSDIKERGTFSCSDETLNALQQCTRNADLANFYYFPTDCPHREKNGWTADAWLSSEHMLLNLTVEKSLREWLFNITLAQREDGALPGIIPTGGWGFEWGNGPVWDSVCVEIPYSLYKYTGNKEIIHENAPMIMKYLRYLSSMRDEKGLTGFGLGDWVDPFLREKGYFSSPLEVTASMATCNMSNKAGFLFEQAGLQEESNFAYNLAAEMRQSIRENLVDFDTMTVLGECQTAQTLGLTMGIFNDNEVPQAEKRLLEIIHRDGDINACGVIGIRYIYHLLTKMGEAELAYKIITAKSRTCYGHWIEQGVTTLCESFTAFDSRHVDSRNHHFFGDISSWFIQSIAGLKPNPKADDISHYEISPNFLSALNFANASYDSPFGKVAVKWERKNTEIKLYLEIPDGIHGKIILPKGYCFKNSDTEKDLVNGSREFEVISK